jgi:MoxR-like ATPase
MARTVEEAHKEALRAHKSMLVVGPLGTAKVKYIAAGPRELAVSGTPILTSEDLFGEVGVDAEGHKAWRDGPLPRAMKAGQRLFVSDIDSLPAKLREMIFIAIRSRSVVINGDIVAAKAGFAVDATASKTSADLVRVFPIRIDTTPSVVIG